MTRQISHFRGSAVSFRFRMAIRETSIHTTSLASQPETQVNVGRKAFPYSKRAQFRTFLQRNERHSLRNGRLVFWTFLPVQGLAKKLGLVISTGGLMLILTRYHLRCVFVRALRT